MSAEKWRHFYVWEAGGWWQAHDFCRRTWLQKACLMSLRQACQREC